MKSILGALCYVFIFNIFIINNLGVMLGTVNTLKPFYNASATIKTVAPLFLKGAQHKRCYASDTHIPKKIERDKIISSFMKFNFLLDCTDKDNCNVQLTRWFKPSETLTFTQFRDVIKNTYSTMSWASMGNWYEQSAASHDVNALKLFKFIYYTNNVNIETLPNNIQEIIKRRRSYISAIEGSKTEDLEKLLQNQDKEPLWSFKENYYCFAFYYLEN